MCEKVINFDRIGNANILNSEHYIHAMHVHLLKNYLENRKYIFFRVIKPRTFRSENKNE